MTDRDEGCAAPALPTGLADMVAGYAWTRDLVGESGGAVYRLHGRAGAPDLYLKHGEGMVADDIIAEMVRLRWLADHLPVPQVVGFMATPDAAWLLTTALPGETAWCLLDREPAQAAAVVDALVAFLRDCHAIPVASCPFVADHRYRLAKARERIDAGLVDEEDFDAERAGWSAEQVCAALQALLPLAPDMVVTHGDFSLDNLLMQDGRVVGCIDVGRVGIADRYQDLAILANCLGEFGDALSMRMFERYGIAAPDRARLDFHLLLDELF